MTEPKTKEEKREIKNLNIGWLAKGKEGSDFECHFHPSSPAGVNRDADGLGHFLADTSRLEFLESETTTETLLDIVLERRAPDHWAESLDRPRSNLQMNRLFMVSRMQRSVLITDVALKSQPIQQNRATT